MSLLEKLKEKVVIYDGAKATVFFEEGLKPGACADEWNLTRPDKVSDLTKAYIDAGAQVVQTNTFCANETVLESFGLAGKEDAINEKGAQIALEAARNSDVLVAGTVGPTGLHLIPAGYTDFERGVQIFKGQLSALKQAGVTLVNFETFMDISELRAAIMAAQEVGGLEVIANMTYNRHDDTETGTPAAACAVSAACLGARVVGANCSEGPESMYRALADMETVTGAELCAKPSAGNPHQDGEHLIYKMKPEQFADLMVPFAQSGVRLLGGCCGTTPEFIAALAKKVGGVTAAETPVRRNGAIISSPLGTLDLSEPNLSFVEMIFSEITEQMIEDDFRSVSEIVPVDWESADACVVDLRHLGLDFDVQKLVSAVVLYMKKPVIVKGGSSDLIELFLRYYPGRAGLVSRPDLPDRLFGAQLVGSGYRPLEDKEGSH